MLRIPFIWLSHRPTFSSRKSICSKLVDDAHLSKKEAELDALKKEYDIEIENYEKEIAAL